MGYSQIQSFRTLQLPDVERHVFTLDGHTNLTIDHYDTDFNLPLNAGFNGYKNYRFRQTFYSLNARSNNQWIDNKSNRLRSYFDQNLTFSYNQYRYNKNYHFLHLYAYGNLSPKFEKHSVSQDSAYVKNRNVEGTYNVSLGIGKGRIDPIDWAIRAGFMNKALLKSGAIKESLPEDALMELARTMAEVDRSRFFEGRFFNIRRIEAIDSVLSKYGEKGNDLAYYTTLSDQYFFAPNRSVFTGKRFELQAGLVGYSGWASRRNQDITILTEQASALSARLALNYSYHLPKNLEWHHLFSATVHYETPVANGLGDQSLNLLERYFIYRESLNFRTEYTLQWFPSTRTSLFWSSYIRYVAHENSNLLLAGSNFSFDYFVNRRLSYNLNSAVNFENNNNNSSFNFTAGLRYQVW